MRDDRRCIQEAEIEKLQFSIWQSAKTALFTGISTPIPRLYIYSQNS